MRSAYASSAAQKLARELGLDAGGIIGTGAGGRITVADVRAVAPPDPPDTLGEAGAALWLGVCADVELRTDEEVVLLEACRTKDELERLTEKLAATSLTVTGSKGQVRPHPLIAEVRQHRLALQRLLASIGISEAQAEGGEARAAQARAHAGRQLARQRWSGPRG